MEMSYWVDRFHLRSSYILINLVLAGVILSIFIYSGIFDPVSNNYPVKCYHEIATGEECPSCGMSHSFSLILKGKVAESLEWNSYALRLGIFFGGQLLLRLIYCCFWITSKKENRRAIIAFDIVGSTIMFLIVFYPFAKFTFISIFR